jgi:putative redox protein
VHVDGTLTEDHPKIYKTIAVTYDVGTTEAYRPLVEKAVQMSVEKYCGVSAMLAASADITHTIVLSGTDQMVGAAGGATTNH